MKRVWMPVILSMAVMASGVALGQDKPDNAGASAATATATAPMVSIGRRAKVGVIHLESTLAERPASFSLSLSSIMGGGKSVALSNLIVTLNNAAKDPAISGMVLDLTSFSLSLNQAQEIGTLLKTVRAAGKRVAIYSADYDTATYVLGTYADTMIMPEGGDVLIPGTGLQMIFFAGALEKLHMSADFVQVGKFKGAEEPYTRKSASPEYRAQIEKLVDGMYSEIVSTIAANRPNLTEAQVKKYIDEGWMTGKRAKELGLIDQTMTRDRLDRWVSTQFPNGASLVDDYGEPKKESVDLSSPLAVFSLLSSSDKPKKSTLPGIAVIYATGEIDGDTSSITTGETVTPRSMRAAVQAALDDDHVKAIVLRVDSPGGSAAASDEIWSLLKEADKKKPVTVSMGQLAASGGYYISCAGRSIMADPATITGSIGVVGGKVVLKGTLDWVGVNIEPVDRGAHAEMMSALRPYTDEERDFIRKQMEEVYGTFTSRVTAARGEKVAKLEEVAQGRLFTGIQAKEAGLVDEVGTLSEAIKAAAKNAKIDGSYQIIVLPEAKTIADILRDGFMSTKAPLALGGVDLDASTLMLAALPKDVRGPTQQALRMLQQLDSERVLLAMPPGLVEMHPKHR